MQNREALAQQRGAIDNTIGRLKAAAGLLPGVNQVLFRIRRRKARDMIILSVVIVVGVVVLYFYANR